ncbi:hypothetical protein LINPERHAP1_LOCUS8035 [Linum perenne]
MLRLSLLTNQTSRHITSHVLLHSWPPKT